MKIKEDKMDIFLAKVKELQKLAMELDLAVIVIDLNMAKKISREFKVLKDLPNITLDTSARSDAGKQYLTN